MNDRQKKFFSYYKPYLGLLFIDMVCACIVSGVTLLLPLCATYITQVVITGGLPNTIERIYEMGAVMIGLVIVHAGCNTFVDYQGHMMGSLMESDMRSELFDHYQKLSFSFYDERKTGQLMTLITNDLLSLSEFYHHGPEDLVIALLKAIGVFVILIRINVPLTTIVFFFMPLMSAYAFYFNGKMNIALGTNRDRIGDINAQVEDTIAGIRVVKSFANEAVERRKFAHENQRFIDSRREWYKSEAYFYEGMVVFGQLITIAVVIFGSISIVRHTLSITQLVMYIFCAGILIEPIQRVVNFARLYQEGTTAFRRFMDILDIQPDIQESPDAIDLTDVQGHIIFNNVSFRYKETYDYVLDDISLDIKSGEYIALVGASGAGKTTLCSLIPRFYEINQGTILVDGIDIRQVTLRSLRMNIGIVQQDIYLFAGTVLENIRYGKLDATREEIIDAAKLANAHDFIMALPDDYDTDIGQRGVKLSGGQKQRLSIARVFLKNPPIIIFDEATSSLDNESERAVQESLEKLTQNRTMLVIAHRLSTIRNAQRIIVLTDDGISEQGTHDELLALDGVYAGLQNTQLQL